MGDIAASAGISRAALYVMFAGVIQRLNDRQLAGIRATVATLPSLQAKLRHACETWGAHGADLMAKHPNARDLFDLGRASVRQVYAEFQALIVDRIAGASAASPLRAAPDELARMLTFAMRGFWETVADSADMRRLIALLVSVLLAALDAES